MDDAEITALIFLVPPFVLMMVDRPLLRHKNVHGDWQKT